MSEYQKAVTFPQGDTDTIAGLAHGYAGMSRRVTLKRFLPIFLRPFKRNYVSPYMIATVYVDLAQKDKAFEFLDKSL